MTKLIKSQFPSMPILLATVLLIGCFPWSTQSNESAPERKVGLVLGGGGAKGLAHIGVLQFLEENRIPVDFVVGTSMGAIAGGLYAQGHSPDYLENLVRTVDWQDIFSDETPRASLSIHRKEDARLFPVQATLGFSDGKFKLPQGVVQGQKLMPLLRRHSIYHANISHFDHYPLPFRATGADIETGELVILDQGDIALAMRASMAIPGVFSPVQWDEQFLVDGGMVNNLPIDIALNMGATQLIVVDVSNDYPGIEALNGPLAISEQAINLMIRNNSLQQLEALRQNDIHIAPNLLAVDVSTAGFGEAQEAIQAGYNAAQANAQALLRLQVPEAEWQQYLATLRAPQAEVIPRWFRLENASNLPDDLLWANMATQAGEPFNPELLEQDIERIYGLGFFEHVDYQVLWQDQTPGVEIQAVPRSWGPDYLSFGFTLEENFNTESTYRAALSYLRTEVNSYGAELQYDLQVGNEPLLRARYWQPLRRDARAYSTAFAQFHRVSVNQYAAGEFIGTAEVSTQQLGFALGTQWQHRADIRLAYTAGRGNIKMPFEQATTNFRDSFATGELALHITLDTLDSVFLPKQGSLLQLRYGLNDTALSADQNYQQAEFNYLGATTYGDHTFIQGLRVHSTVAGTSPLYDNFSLGGFMNLSGHER